ncbi:MAG: glycosyltransferase family 4 protein [Candidatus Acidiferrales bacterium]
MTTPALQIAQTVAERGQVADAHSPADRRFDGARRRTFCHFTTAHTSLKSRSFHRQCKPLSEAGFDVSYVSPVSEDRELQGIRFIRLARPTSLAGRAFGQLRLLLTLLGQRADIYHFQDPQLLALGMAIKLVFHQRVIYDAYEDFPSMAAHKTTLPPTLRTLLSKTIAGTERFGARWFDAIITADPLTMRRLARVGRSHKCVFYNFPNLDLFPATQKQKKSFDVVYRGGLSERAGTFLLLDSLQKLANAGRDVRLLLIGYCDGAGGERQLRNHIAQRGLTENVEIRGRIPHEEMAAALGEARIGVSPLADTPKFRLNIPVKIFEYWACGLPVIASDLPPSRPFMRGSDGGLCFPAGDANALGRAIAKLLDDPEEASAMGRRGREIIEKRLNNRGEMPKLISLCRAILSEQCATTETEYEHA